MGILISSSKVGQLISSQPASHCLLSTALLQTSQHQYYQTQGEGRKKSKGEPKSLALTNSQPQDAQLPMSPFLLKKKIEKPFGFIGLTADSYAFYGDLFGSD